MCRGQGSRRVGNLAAGLNRCGDGRIDIVHQSIGSACVRLRSRWCDEDERLQDDSAAAGTLKLT